MNMNRAHLMGRLGADPVTRTSQNGKKWVTFSLATQDFIKTKNESETTWHRIVAFGKLADTCERYLKKGSAIYVDGTMKVKKFEGENGQMKYMHEIHAFTVKFLGYKTGELAMERNTDEMEEATIELDEQHRQS